jgi:hypothetical protein
LGKFPLPRDEAELVTEIAEVERKCYAIVDLCELLIPQFPDAELPIKLVKASILPNVC